MATPEQVLLGTLEDLGEDDFKKFKWLLQQEGVLEVFPAMRKNQLENADRMDIVDQNGFGGDKSERSRGEIVKHHLRTNR